MEAEVNPSELSQCRERLQRKLAASFEGWHSGRVDRLEEALRSVERALDHTAKEQQENESCTSVFASPSSARWQ